MQANNSTTNTSANAALNPTSSSSAAATASSSASVPASRPLQWPTGLTVHQQQRFQAEFERKRKEMEVQQKRLQAELQANHRAQLAQLQQKHDSATRHLAEQARQIQQQAQNAQQQANSGNNTTNSNSTNTNSNNNTNNGSNSTLTGGWQSDRDIPDRRGMIQRIVQLLQQRKPNASEEWVLKLPTMAKRLEESLYRNAASFDEYNDANTLKSRLQRLAMNIGYKSQQNKLVQQQQAQMKQQEVERQQLLNAQQQQVVAQQQEFQTRYRQVVSEAASVAGQMVKQQQQQQQQLHQQQQQQQVMNSNNVKTNNPTNNTSNATTQLVNLSAINPNLVTNAGNNTGSVPSSANSVSNPGAIPSGSSVNPVSTSGASTGASGSGGNTNDRQQVLRHQQQRLLLLRHAAKCPHNGTPTNRCPVTPHCSGMKKLWKHIAECKNQKCLVPHCVSSRYVLSHYHRCKDVRCPVCGPVREAIHRSHEKAKAMQALKASHRSAVRSASGGTNTAASLTNPAVNNSSMNVPSSSSNINNNSMNVSSSSNVNAQPPANKRRRPANASDDIDVAVPLTAPSSSNAMQSSMVSGGSSSHNKNHSTTLPHTTGGGASGPPITSSTGSASRPITTKSGSSSTSQKGTHYVYNQPPSTAITTTTSSSSSSSRPQEDHTLINCFTIEQIETHIHSLYKGLQLPSAKLKSTCGDVLKVLQSHPHAWVFNAPVDPVELQLPDYFQVITNPMDLGTIKKRLENGCYHAMEEFESDVNLVFDNAMLYNAEGSVVYNMAQEMKNIFTQDYARAMRTIQAEQELKRKNGDACALCGCEKLLFEPPIFYCNGLNCQNTRIRRNSYYYTGQGNPNYHWCHVCYGELRDDKAIVLADCTLHKKDLIKKKNDDVHEESWVQCDKCERWIHQICALFNTRQNKDQQSEYTCPRCSVEERRKKGTLAPTSTTPMATDLDRSKLSEYLEEHVRRKVSEKFHAMALKKSQEENIEYSAALAQVQFGGEITIRQITSTNRKLEVRDRMRKRYAHKNYPTEFNFRCKMIVVFQNLDGVDVILFGIYFFEHGLDNPAPNTRSVYISYLDSVHYMRPRKMRTFVYHEILIAYLDYVRRRGFASAHIWACPPLKGDDYILFCKPEDQKTPREDRLRQWYLDMLVECQVRGICGKVTNMYDLYFNNPELDAACVPYFEGDYFISEVENIIKDLEGGGKKHGSSSKKSNKKADTKKTKKKGRSGTRSSGIDEDALAESGILAEGTDVRGLKEGQRDFVMKKLGDIIKPMKESFIVAYLNYDGIKEEHKAVPEPILHRREKYLSEHKDDPPYKIQVTPMTLPSTSENGGGTPMHGKGSLSTNTTPVKSTSMEGSGSTKALGESSTATDASKAAVGATATPKKRDPEGNIKTPSTELTSTPSGKSNGSSFSTNGSSLKIIDDDEEEMECEFLNNRQAFLNLCQGNHYQFDQLRRAKHTSMMVLWHLHNRDAPKFVQQCANCSREILTGYRYHCNTCNDYDVCHDCLTNPNFPRHPHQLQPLPVTSGEQKSQQTDAQRRERQRNIQLHLQLLRHAATCDSTSCHSANCQKMKGIFNHATSCPNRANGLCHICKRIWMLFQIHARQCKESNCKVPNCNTIREKLRQLTKQQQAMDDRRRQEMNRAYRVGNRA